jgi:threonine dehydratase
VGEVVEAVTAEGAELDTLERARRTGIDHPNRTPVTIGIEGRDPDHLETVLTAVSALDGVSVVEQSVGDES